MTKSLSKDTYSSLYNKIAEIIQQARGQVARAVNKTQVLAYWEIGHAIVAFEQKGKTKADYGERLIEKLSRDMSKRFGKGFGRSNLFLMRQFYVLYNEKVQTVSGKSKTKKIRTESGFFDPKLSWSHYCELLSIDEPLRRLFYEKEAFNNNWSVRELKRQIASLLFERLALSKDKKAVMKMAKKGQIIEKPEDIIKDPYSLHFLGLKEEHTYSESEVETAIIDKLQDFLLEMGRGFCFVARQKRITLDNEHYYIDLVLYNRILKCLVLIDLKKGKLTHADAGQMNFYLNYCKEQEVMEDENEPIGLILCSEKKHITAKYILGGLTNKVFASQYKLALPSEKELMKQIERRL